ncbi:Aspartate/glutamate/uridylate kinase, partial [Vararia minispora EC-137]
SRPTTPSPTRSGSLSDSPESFSPPKTPPNLHQNSIDSAVPWLVQKYGGTSVGKFAHTIARDIIPSFLDDHKLAIVCSARSGSTKALGTTNLLLRAASEALRRMPNFSAPASPSARVPSSIPVSPAPSGVTTPLSSSLLLHRRASSAAELTQEFSATVDVIRNEHIAAARDTIQDPKVRAELEAEIVRDCEGLRAFLYAAQVIDEISPRSKDSIIGFGEKLGCKLMAAALRDQGVDAEFVSLDGVVPPYEDYVDGSALPQDFFDRAGAAFAARIRECAPRVPVVTGFFGPVPGSLLRQVGRGYTDLAAALLAAGLGAAELQIWKEVDGIFTADPRKVPTARLIPVISPEEAAELTYYGSEVVHPFTMEQVIRRKIPIRIKNVENPRGGGTVIQPDADEVPSPEEPPALAPINMGSQTLDPAHLALALADGVSVASARQKLPTAVTIKERIVVLNVQSNRKSVSHGFLAAIFGTLDRYGVVVDLISTSEVYVSMAIEDVHDRKYVARVVRELEKIGTVSVHHNMAILSLVGRQMRHLVGIAGRFFASLAQGNINIEMISQGANEINISCVVDARDAVKALNLIHQSCLQIKPEGPKGRVGPWLF